MALTQKHDAYPVLFFSNEQEYEVWLKKNFDLVDGIWIKFAKAKSGIESLNYKQAVDVSLCYGWIDGLARSVDDIYYLQKFTPRRTNSIWSEINKKKVGVLTRAGRMQPPGLAAIREAKKNGRWKAAYAPPSSIKIPTDFKEALAKNKKANAFFNQLNAQNRYAILYRLSSLKKVETRDKKILQFIDMLAQEKTIYP